MPWSDQRYTGSSGEGVVDIQYAAKQGRYALTLRRQGPRDILLPYLGGSTDEAPADRKKLTMTRQAAARVVWKRYGGLFNDGVSTETGPHSQDDLPVDFVTAVPVYQVGRYSSLSGEVTQGLTTFGLENAGRQTALSSLLARNISATGPFTADSRRNV